jgi:hypothetical protein
VRVSAALGEGVLPNNGPLKGRGFRLWNQSTAQTVFPSDYPDLFAKLGPVFMVGARNGTFGGQIVAGDEKPMKGLRVEVADLKGPGTIPASAVQVRYGLPDGAPGERGPAPFDSLEETPPAEVPVNPKYGFAVQPLWVTVRIPEDAKPGDYSGTLTVRVEGEAPAAVPLAVRVLNWKLPPPQAFSACLDIAESPESVAMAYNVPLWSPEHLKLLDKTFALLGQLGNKTLYITAIRRTHWGNEQAVIRWKEGDDGELTPDFSLAEKYLDLAMKHMGKFPGLIFYCWEPFESEGHVSGTGTAARTFDKPILITVIDPDTGEPAARIGPAWGTPEAAALWKKFAAGAQDMLKKRGMENNMLLGLVGDSRPTKQAMDDVAGSIPGARWAVHSHYLCPEWQGYPMGMFNALWGIGCDLKDPTQGYSFGWSNPRWMGYFAREMSPRSTLMEHRTKVEAWIGAVTAGRPFVAKGIGPRGLGRLGADFWPVVKDERGRIRGTLAGRYPEACWGQLNLNNGVPHCLGRGKDGPVATARSEGFREGLQEIEARVYLEKAILDDALKDTLGDDLRKRIRDTLDERIRVCIQAARYTGAAEVEPWYIASGWQARSERLFGLAAEVSAKLGDRQPAPDMTPEPEKKR